MPASAAGDWVVGWDGMEEVSRRPLMRDEGLDCLLLLLLSIRGIQCQSELFLPKLLAMLPVPFRRTISDYSVLG